MTQIGGVFSFPLLEAAEEVEREYPEVPHCRESHGRFPRALTSLIKLNGAAEGFFYVLE